MGDHSGCNMCDAVLPDGECLCAEEAGLSIGGYAFSGCTSLKEIHIPDSVVSIGSYAFQVCQEPGGKYCAASWDDCHWRTGIFSMRITEKHYDTRQCVPY